MNSPSLSNAGAYALVCRQYGNPPDIQPQPLDRHAPLKPDEVLIDVHCAAFNFTDHLLVQGRYQEKPTLPFVPGLDAAGVVRAVGAEASGFRPGDRVISSGVVGAWSTQLAAPAHRLVTVPENVDLADAVASINSHLTAYHALLDRAALKAGEHVLVLGANGAVGKACVQIARHAGATVYTVARQGDNEFRLAQEGNDHTRMVSAESLKQGLRELLGRRGADVVVDPVGDHFTEAAVRNLAWRGRLLVVGFAAGDIPKIPTNLLLLKGCSILGVYCGGLLIQETASFTEQLAAMLQLMSAGVLTPSPHETLAGDDFAPVWSRFSSAPRGTKVLLGFAPSL
ncbi:MAG TPA: NADPH:quinone oxidoreductase family protein [Pusillimonas sp.]|uniref:NADPH:quinone oxidoreductase family protein n=1 Tax=Pusillimonas sp. TaxID=3040095 RepID=UPI002BBA42B4|nr:NADPH:quinone oxidoreductase family protein [Pusillimonas sp.]HUH87669.1 NADPH:quinone oxidoreductase family protein [Pusillimonas sp.]